MFTKMRNFNFTLEVLQGCALSCKDCVVDKTSGGEPTTDTDARDLLALMDDIKARDFKLFEFTLAPTDFLSATNSIEWLDKPLTKGLIERFNSLTVSMALLTESNLVERTQLLNTALVGKGFRLILPASIKNLRNDKYLELMRKNIGLLKANLPDVEFQKLYLAINFITESAELFDHPTIEFNKNLELGVYTIVDYNFAHSRGDLNNLITRSELYRDIKHYFDIVKQDYDKYWGPYRHTAIELMYRDGKLYYVPVVNERFPIFDDYFEIPKPWTVDAVMGVKEQFYYKSLELYSDHPLCGDCPLASNCSFGDEHTIMAYLKEERCILGMKE